MKKDQRRGVRKRRWTEPGKKEERRCKRKQWRQGEPERHSYKDRKKSGETQREPEGTVRSGNRGDVWGRVQVTELNPCGEESQGDQVPVRRPILKPLLARSVKREKEGRGKRSRPKVGRPRPANSRGRGLCWGNKVGGSGSWTQIWPVPQAPSLPSPVPGASPDSLGPDPGRSEGRGEGEDQAFSLLFYFFPLN